MDTYEPRLSYPDQDHNADRNSTLACKQNNTNQFWFNLPIYLR